MSGGMALSRKEDGYVFVPHTRTLEPGGGPLAFSILGPEGVPVTKFAVSHERALHLVMVRHDLGHFVHVHPILDSSSGRWSVCLAALPPGEYRVVADFQADGGPSLPLGADVVVRGRVTHEPPTQEQRVVELDGYEVSVDTSGLAAGGVIDVTVRRGASLVTDLQPYLGAAGHLVAFRADDLAYLHVHPHGSGDGSIRFHAVLPGFGRYGLFFDFRHAGLVRNASFVVNLHRRSSAEPADGKEAA
jgi:hypothetical protein